MQDVVLKLPAWLLPNTETQQPDRLTVIFFITGNPGLISYYVEFLELVAGDAGKEAIVAGASLGGFEMLSWSSGSSTLENALLHPQSAGKEKQKEKDVYDLRGQIELSYERLNGLVTGIRREYPQVANLPLDVVVMGHSVGAYIALELVRLHSEAGRADATHSAKVAPYSITATILLTPTIQDIAASPSGRIATPVLSNLPFFPALVQAGATLLSASLPVSWLRGAVAKTTGMTNPDALNATVSFLQTPGAVKQALHMARHEMLEIKGDDWSGEVWGAINEVPAAPGDHVASLRDCAEWQSPRHYFLFAKEDHWVAETTRDAIVKSRGVKAKILVDQDEGMDLVHAWCLNQSRLVADIVNKWLVEILSKE